MVNTHEDVQVVLNSISKNAQKLLLEHLILISDEEETYRLINEMKGLEGCK